MSVNKCSYTQDGTSIKACDALCEATEDGQPSEKKKGIWHIEYSAKGELLSKSYFVVTSGRHTDKAIVFNFCPFCGEKFDILARA